MGFDVDLIRQQFNVKKAMYTLAQASLLAPKAQEKGQDKTEQMSQQASAQVTPRASPALDLANIDLQSAALAGSQTDEVQRMTGVCPLENSYIRPQRW